MLFFTTEVMKIYDKVEYEAMDVLQELVDLDVDMLDDLTYDAKNLIDEGLYSISFRDNKVVLTGRESTVVVLPSQIVSGQSARKYWEERKDLLLTEEKKRLESRVKYLEDAIVRVTNQLEETRRTLDEF